MYIIHLGYSGFPKGNATIKRILLIFKAIKIGGLTPLIINKHSSHSIENANRINRYQGIPYINTSPILTRPDSLLLRNLNKFFGYIGEFYLLLKKRKKIHASIFYQSSIIELFYYRILSKIFSFKLIVHYVEFRSAVPERRKALPHFNDRLFDNFCMNLCDGIIVISEYLQNHVKSRNKLLPMLKIPAICNFDEFTLKENINQSHYLMYCGGIIYISVIEFVLDLYIELQNRKLYKGNLLLAIGGGENQIAGFKVLKDRISASGYKDKINLMTDVPHTELIDLYINSELLIVPLRNTIQDIAGFHHKIGEYCASGKPIISTNIAEMKFYFKDNESAILATEFTLESYTQRLSEILSDKEKLIEIGDEGYKVGMSYLNYNNYVNNLVNFLTTI
jgi:glycosyltransferase involved in cell wall biosynthesis